MDVYVEHAKLSVTDVVLSLDARRHRETPLISLDKKLINQLEAVAPHTLLERWKNSMSGDEPTTTGPK
jgi:hypothetical protein